MINNSALCMALAAVALYLVGKVLYPEQGFRALFYLPFGQRVRWYLCSMLVGGIALMKFSLP